MKEKPSRRFVLGLALAAPAALVGTGVDEALAAPPGHTHVAPYEVHEVVLTAQGAYANPYTEASVSAVFSGPGGASKTVQGFWDGGSTFRIRFATGRRGAWSYTTTSSDPGLGGQTGSFVVTGQPASAGFIRRDMENPRHFVREDGSRFFMLGTTNYFIVGNAVVGGGWRDTVAGNAAIGFTKTRFYAFSATEETVPASYPYAGDTLNVPHLQALDDVVRFMGDKEMGAELILIGRRLTIGTPDQTRRYVRYMIARYAAFPHLLWCVANEWDRVAQGTTKAFFNELGAVIGSEDPWGLDGGAPRALSVHQRTNIAYAYFDQAWPSHAVFQYGVRNLAYRFGDQWGNVGILFNASASAANPIPIVNDEWGYIGEPDDRSEVPSVPLTREKHRNIMWGTLIAGGYGTTGDKGIRGPTVLHQPYSNGDWFPGLAEYGDVTTAISFFTTSGIPYWKMSSDNALVTGGTRVYALAEAGKHYLVYAAVGGSFSVTLPAGHYRATLFDPRTGQETDAGHVHQAADGPAAFSMPDTQDWILYLR